MSQSHPTPNPRALPKTIEELCAHLEERGIASFSHGEGLLHDLHTQAPPRVPTRSLLCAATSEDLLRALPRAVVSAADGRRFTQATSDGPVDVIVCGESEPAEVLPRFGLSPLAFAYRPKDESWLDPLGHLPGWQRAELDLATRDGSPFATAPRRYWIAARLIAEHGVHPTDALLASAREAFDEVAPRLPQAAPARRELTRVFAAPRPSEALAFLRDTGVSDFLVPGTQAIHAARLDRLPNLPALRWAVWLRGSATASAMVRLRVPHLLARRVERMQGAHPIDRAVSPGRDVGLRKLLGRLDEEELDALFIWRRCELDEATDREEAARAEARLVALEERIESIREAQSRIGEVRALALDGRTVMERLGAGPGRHVGQALAHLARFVAADPNANEAGPLEQELVRWARANTNLLDASAEDES